MMDAQWHITAYNHSCGCRMSLDFWPMVRHQKCCGGRYPLAIWETASEAVERIQLAVLGLGFRPELHSDWRADLYINGKPVKRPTYVQQKDMEI